MIGSVVGHAAFSRAEPEAAAAENAFDRRAITALNDSTTGYADAVRTDIDEAGDPDTADLLTEISRAVDEQSWFLEVHVQEPTGTLRDGDAARRGSHGSGASRPALRTAST